MNLIAYVKTCIDKKNELKFLIDDNLFDKAFAEVSEASCYINCLLHDTVFCFVNDSTDKLEDFHSLIPAFNVLSCFCDDFGVDFILL